MIQSFSNLATEDIFNGVQTKSALKLCPAFLWRHAGRKLDQLEALSGDRYGQHSIRINRQYRICFEWTVSGPENVEIIDYH
jgi:toxin HigB-1